MIFFVSAMKPTQGRGDRMRRMSGAVIALAVFTWASQAISAETVTYTYDARGRLVKVVHTGGPANGTQTTYTHDAADNRTRVQVTGASR